MTDGSKRQLSPDPETRVKTGKIQVSVGMDCRLTPEVWKKLEQAGKDHVPADVGSTLLWSQTLITFGKLKPQELSYLELALSSDADHVSYVKWIQGHSSDRSSPQLVDLSQFLKVFNEVIPLSHNAKKVFAASSIERRFKTH